MRLAHAPSWRLALTALLAVASPASPAMAQIVDTGTPPTVPNWPIFPFGRASAVSYASFGQSFIAPGSGAIRLDAFEFWLRDNAITGTTPYYAYIFDWTPATRRTGSTYLFRSDAQNYTGAPVPTAMSFLTGGLDLVGGSSYLAVLSSVEFPAAPVSLRPGAVVSTNWPNDVFTDGASFVRHGPAGLATLTDNAWALAGGTGHDLAFRATFSSVIPTTPVPEPATVALVGLGLLALGATARRRA